MLERQCWPMSHTYHMVDLTCSVLQNFKRKVGSLVVMKNPFDCRKMEWLCHIKIPMPKGLLFGMYLECKTAQIAASKPRITTVQQAHEVLGHCDEEKTWHMANLLGIKLTRASGKLGPARWKNVPSKKRILTDQLLAVEPAEARIYLDTLSIQHYEKYKTKPRVSKPHWCIMVDLCTQMKFSDF